MRKKLFFSLHVVFLRLFGAEGSRLQGGEIRRLRGLRRFGCRGNHQPRRKDHPCWRRPIRLPGAGGLNMLLYFLFSEE